MAIKGETVARYQLVDAWPSAVELEELQSNGTEVLMETVTIVCEHLQRVAV